MDPKKLAQLVINCISKHNWSDYSVPALALMIERELKNPDIKRKRIERVIENLISSGQLQRTKNEKGNHVVSFPTNTKEGTFFMVSKKDGGYIIPVGTSKKLRVPYEMCGTYKNGDTVFFTQSKIGEIIISKRIPSKGTTNVGLPISNNRSVTGYVFKNENGHYEFLPQDKKRFPNTVAIVNDLRKFGNLEGCIVSAEFGDFDGGENIVAVKEVLGRIAEPLPETNAIAISAGISLTPNPQIEEELKYIPDSVNVSLYNLVDENGKSTTGHYDKSKVDYVDLRDKMFTTIDPHDCRDMDDSVYTELDEDGNFVTYTAIADVTEYIKPGSAIWNAALKQSFTLYTPFDAYAMIPKKLSHGILSLNEGEDRLTLCCKTVIDKNTGERIPEKSKVFHAVINSKKKFSYDEVQKITDENNLASITGNLQKQCSSGGRAPQTLLESVALNKSCSDIIWKHFKERGMLNINRNNETEFVLSDDGTRVLDIKQKEHLKSMEVIEALMINANETFAEYAYNNKLNVVYRVHDQPLPEKILRLKECLKFLDVEYSGNGDNKSLQKLIDENEGTSKSSPIKEFVLRAQSKAKYSNKPYPTDAFGEDKPQNKCHSALCSDLYTHFTSGIRRMADLIIQYAIKENLRNHGQPFTEEYVAQVSMLISSMELVIEEAERKIDDMYAAIWAEEHINEVITGEISSFNGDFVIVEDKQKGIRVSVPISELCENGKANDMGIALCDEKGKEVYKLTDQLSVKISGADRIGRVIYASTNLTKTYKNEFAITDETIKQHFENVGLTAGEQLIASWKKYNEGKKGKKSDSEKAQSSSQVPTQNNGKEK